MSRPEHTNAPELFYNEAEAKKYAMSSRMHAIQREITERALELLNFKPGETGKLILDVGCGSGLSGGVIQRMGHNWIGLDISSAMVNIAMEEVVNRSHSASRVSNARGSDDGDDDDDDEQDDDEEEEEEEEEDMEQEEDDDDDDDEEEDDDDEEEPLPTTRPLRGNGDVLVRDMGCGLGLRPNTLDGCVSISAVQWLCYSHHKHEIPQKRLRAFFSSLYSSLRRGARAAIQLYPETPEQMEMITNAAMSAGFTGGVVVDYPNSAKAKKYYLVLMTGSPSSNSNSASNSLPRGLGTDSHATGRAGGHVAYESSRVSMGKKRRRDGEEGRGGKRKKTKAWIQNKKEVQRKQGKDVRPDSKYSGRKRGPRF